jgi:hypothetical protein
VLLRPIGLNLGYTGPDGPRSKFFSANCTGTSAAEVTGPLDAKLKAWDFLSAYQFPVGHADADLTAE